ncbi:glutathione ABC transporter substrate-binding protein [Bacillus sp. JJ1562]|uniref:glutathione ABC transporter substrate-binding protein n=1 Tax=Bacillus sp. JJ1562 TaxID=3122960 RepID=UPI003001DC44
MKTKKNLFLVLLLSMVLALAACGSDKSSKEDEKGNTDAPAEATEGGDLVYVTPADAPTLDPHGVNDTASNNATSQIYERLTDYAEDGSVIPMLATEFSAVDDTTWEFKLREGVKFHDGTDFNAEAVKASLDRILDPEFASPKIVVVNMISSVEVVDEYTVHIKTEKPFAPLPAHLAHNAGSIIAPSAIEEENNGGKTVSENPIGTGPFKLEKWNTGDSIQFAKNQDYWGEKAKADTLTFKVVPDQSTRVAMLETGEAHALLLGSSDVARVEAMQGIELDRVSSTRMDYLGFNMQKAPFDNEKVRQAIAMAINKEDIVDGILDGQGLAAIGPLAPTVVGNSQELEPLAYDVEEAKKLLAEAGFEDGFKTSLQVNTGNAERENIAKLIQAQLAPIGIEVEIDLIEWGTFLEKTAVGEHELFILGWTTVTGDADYGLYALFHSSMFGEAGNRAFYKNDRVDELLDLARTEADQEKRNVAYKEISEILIKESPMVYLQHPDFVHGMNGIDGLFVNSSGTPFFKDVVITK